VEGGFSGHVSDGSFQGRFRQLAESEGKTPSGLWPQLSLE